MNRRSIGLPCIFALGALAACSAAPSSVDDESAGSTAQAVTTKPIDYDDEQPPPTPIHGVVDCKYYAAPAGQCGLTYVASVCDGTTKYAADPACPDGETCGGGPVPVAGSGTPNACGGFPPACAPSGFGDQGCVGTDADPYCNQNGVTCELTPSIFELLAPSSGGPLMIDFPDYSTGTVLPCTVWNFESWNASNDGYSYFVAYCQDSATATGTVMGDWAAAVNQATGTELVTVATATPPYQVVEPLGTTYDQIERGTPYDAQLTTQPRSLGPAASGYIYVQFRANYLMPKPKCYPQPSGPPICDQGCDQTTDAACVILTPIVVPEPIEVPPVQSPPGLYVAGGF